LPSSHNIEYRINQKNSSKRSQASKRVEFYWKIKHSKELVNFVVEEATEGSIKLSKVFYVFTLLTIHVDDTNVIQVKGSANPIDSATKSFNDLQLHFQ
jgi:hypothetical protein